MLKPLLGTPINRGHPRARGLVGAWLLGDSTNPSTFRDSSPCGRHGTPSGTFDAAPTLHGGISSLFNGLANNAITARTADISADVTVSAWICGLGSRNTQNAFIGSKGAVNSQWQLFFEGGDLKWRGGNTGSDLIDGGATIIDDTWRHVVGKQIGTTAWIYVDGRLRTTGSAIAIGNSTEAIFIGAYSGDGISPSSYYLFGNLAGVEIHSRGLTDAEITDAYANPYGLWARRKRAYAFLAGAAGRTGIFAVTLANITSASTGALALAGATATILADFTLTSVSTLALAGALAQTITIGVASLGRVALSSVLAKTIANVTLTGVSTLAISGASAKTLADVTLTAAGGNTTTGQTAVTLADTTLQATGIVAISGVVVKTLANITSTASGSISISGITTQTLANIVANGQGSISISGVLNKTLQSFSLSAIGISDNFVFSTERTLTIALEDRSLNISFSDRILTIEP